MTRNLQFACLGAALCTAGALAQTTTSPVAYVYVSNTINTNAGTIQVKAFAAAPNGRLTRVPGSPFPDDVTSMAVNGLYLFGSQPGSTNILAYSIESDGSLRHSFTSSVQQPGQCDNAGSLELDHTGQTLYNVDIVGNNCANSTYQSFAIQPAMNFLKLLRAFGCTFPFCLMQVWNGLLALQGPKTEILNFNMPENHFFRIDYILCTRQNASARHLERITPH